MSDWFRKQPKLPGGHRTPQTPAMPTLPDVPKRPWLGSVTPTQLPEDKKGISAKVVMHHFARGEVRNLEKGADDLHARLVAKLQSMAPFKTLPRAMMPEIIRNMTAQLQACDLTINFKAGAWFLRPNTYTTYTQMYERGTRTVQGADGSTNQLLKGNAMNPADSRDVADTKVSFGPNAAMPGMQGVARFMQTGGLKKTQDSDTSGEYAIANPQFNAKAKPIFAALNIGKRPNGSNTGYGRSHLVLHERYKRNAIYYMGDTFTPATDHTSRVTYGTLLALILHATPEAAKDIVDACFRGAVLPNTDVASRLAEAHIYDQIAFHGGATELVVSRSEARNSATAWMLSGGVEVAKPDDVENNVKIFAGRNHLKLRWVD